MNFQQINDLLKELNGKNPKEELYYNNNWETKNIKENTEVNEADYKIITSLFENNTKDILNILYKFKIEKSVLIDQYPTCTKSSFFSFNKTVSTYNLKIIKVKVKDGKILNLLTPFDEKCKI
jgi:urate oxidase